MRRHSVAVLVAILTLVGGAVAQASPITYAFSGTFTAAGGAFAALLNTEFSGVLLYDSDWPLYSVSADVQEYSMPAGAISVSLVNGVVVSDTAPAGAAVIPMPAGGIEYLLFDVPSASPTATSISFYFRGPTGALGGLDLPPSLPGLDTWDTEWFRVSGSSGSAEGSLISLTTDAVAVPEPGSTLLLVGMGLVGLGVCRKR